MNASNSQLRGAHACSVLVVAFRDDELFVPGVKFLNVSSTSLQSSFRQNAETGTLQACAPRITALTLLT